MEKVSGRSRVAQLSVDHRIFTRQQPAGTTIARIKVTLSGSIATGRSSLASKVPRCTPCDPRPKPAQDEPRGSPSEPCRPEARRSVDCPGRAPRLTLGVRMPTPPKPAHWNTWLQQGAAAAASDSLTPGHRYRFILNLPATTSLTCGRGRWVVSLPILLFRNSCVRPPNPKSPSSSGPSFWAATCALSTRAAFNAR